MGEKEIESSAESTKSGSGAIPALILGVICLGVGVAVGMFLPKNVNPVADTEESETETQEIAIISRTAMGNDVKSEINAKLDNFELSGTLGAFRLYPFYWKQLDAKVRLQNVFTYLRNDDLADYIAAQKNWNGGDPITKTVPIDRVKEIHKKLFGEEPSESDYVSFTTCSTVTGKFDYDSGNNQYKITYAAGCGGYNPEPMDYYRDSYEVMGDTAYVTIEIGAVRMDRDKSYITNDYYGGTVIGEHDYNNNDFVNESTKDKFTKYQFIFDKKDGNWVMRGLYPLGVE